MAEQRALIDPRVGEHFYHPLVADCSPALLRFIWRHAIASSATYMMTPKGAPSLFCGPKIAARNITDAIPPTTANSCRPENDVLWRNLNAAITAHMARRAAGRGGSGWGVSGVIQSGASTKVSSVAPK